MDHTTQEKLIFQLHRCMMMLHRRHGHHRGGGHGPHRGQGRILRVLADRDGMSQKDLAGILGVQPPSLSEVLDRLEAQGLVERRQDEQDKRSSRVFVTDAGRDMGAAVEKARREEAETLLAGLEEGEAEQLSALLEKLAGTLEASLPEGEGCGHHGRGHCRGKHGHVAHGPGMHGRECRGPHEEHGYGCEGHGGRHHDHHGQGEHGRGACARGHGHHEHGEHGHGHGRGREHGGCCREREGRGEE